MVMVNIIIDAVVTYNNNIHSTINMTPVDASNNADKVKYDVKSTKATAKLKAADYGRNADKSNIFSKGYTSNWRIGELFKVIKVLKTQPPTYRTEDINGEILEGKYEQEVLISEFDFESNNKVLESLDLDLRSATK